MAHSYRGGPVVDNAPAFIQTRSGQLATGAGRLTDANGEINAHNKAELAQKISAIYSAQQAGQIEVTAEGRAEANARFADFQDAIQSKDSDRVRLHAEVMADNIVQQANRVGLVRDLVARHEFKAGQDQRIELRRKDIRAFQIMSDGGAIEQIAQARYIYPKTYKLQALVLADELEIAQAGPDFLSNAYENALEAIVTTNDRYLRKLWLAAEGEVNAPVGFSSFSPQTLSSMRTQLMGNAVSAAALVFSYDLWDDMLTDPSFLAVWSEVHKYQLIEEGRLGGAYGMKFYTDGFRPENLKVLEPGEAFAVAAPAQHGAHGIVREVSGREVDTNNLGEAKSGMFFWGAEFLHIEAQSVVSATRLA